MPGTNLTEHSGSDKAWVYTTVDFADEEMRNEMFCIRFGSVESACTLFFPLPTHPFLLDWAVQGITLADDLNCPNCGLYICRGSGVQGGF
jgi:hypothetical protein